MKNKFLLTFLAIPLILTSCGGSSSEDDSSGTSGSNSSGEYSSMDSEAAAAYEKWLSEWSEPGHLYMHYLRPGASKDDYKNWGIWIWPNAPQDLEGSLWGAGNDACKVTIPNVMTDSIMTNVGGSGKDVDECGAIYDIDLTRDDIKGGKSGDIVSFKNASKVGFLVADLTSMDGTKHWTSDGGKNIYIEDFQSHWRDDGSMHVFLVQGDCANYRFYAGGDVEVNPTISDTEGNYRSVESHIADKYPVSKNAETPIKTSSAFKNHGVGYQIFVASFRDSDGDGMGDIQGIIDSLGYLKDDLHVDTLWLTPVQKCESYHGYDTVDYYHIDPRFGTDAKYQELLDKAHEKGMYVLMDLVLNHTSKNNNWYNLSQKASVSADEASGETINWRNIYHWKFKGDKVLYYKDGEYTSINVEDHPDWYKDGESNYYYYGKFGSGMPELNYDNAETRFLVKELAKYWLKKGVDGFRLDAVKHIYMKDEIDPKDNDAKNEVLVADYGTKNYFDEQLLERKSKTFDYSSDVTRNVEFWKEFSGDIKKEYKDCFLVGENFDGYGSRMAPYYQALDSQFDFSNFFHIDEWLFRTSSQKDKDGNGGKADTIGAANYTLSQINDSYKMYKGKGDDADLWEDLDGNPKTDSIKTHNGDYPTGHRSDFINGAFTSNHDTLRAINHANLMSTKNVEVSYKDKEGKTVKETYLTSRVTQTSATSQEVGRAKVAAAMTILNPGLSWIYYGDEIGMSSNTNTHYEKYKNENNEDLWYRQPFKWKNSNIIPGYKFNGYTVEWDDYNANLKDMETQKTTDGSMLKFYMGLTQIKKLFGSSIEYGNPSWSNSNVVVWDVGQYHICVNVSGTAQGFDGGSKNYLVNAASGYTETYSGTIPAYSVLVRKG